MTNQRTEINLDWNTIGAIALIVTGVLFIFGQVFGLGIGAATVALFIFLVLPGMPFLYFAITGNKDLSWLAIPGSLISGTGAILVLQSLTNHWESWAYAWTLYGVLIGLPLLYAGQRNNEKEVVMVGKVMSALSSVGFVALLIFFELFVFNGSAGRLVIALILIGSGAWLIMRDQDLDLGTGFGSADKQKRKNTFEDYMGPTPIETAESYVLEAKSRLRDTMREADGELTDDPVSNKQR